MKTVAVTGVWLCVTAVAAGCGNPDRLEDAERSVVSELECTRKGFPCSWAEVDTATVSLTIQAAWQGRERLDQGGTVEDVVESLRARGDLGGLMTDGRVVRFWLDGGRPMWITGPGAFAQGTRGLQGNPPTSPASDIVRSSNPQPPGLTDPIPPYKQALVLRPFEFEFTEGDGVAQVLKATRDYACDGCVEEKTNDSPRVEGLLTRVPNQPIAFNVGIDDFKDWADYSIIYVSSHGLMLCPQGQEGTAGSSAACVTSILTGRMERLEFSTAIPPNWAEAWVDERGNEGFSLSTEPGVEYVVASPSGICTGQGGFAQLDPGSQGPALAQLHCGQTNIFYQALSDDFFKDSYKTGLPGRIIFLNACETMLDPDRSLATHLVGSAEGESAVIGWTISVPSQSARAVAQTFFQFLLGQEGEVSGGVQVGNALEATIAKLPRQVQGLAAEPSSQTDPSRQTADAAPTCPPGPTRGPAVRWCGQGSTRKRGREIVRLLDAAGRELVDRARLPLVGIPNDGRNDQAELTFAVDGLDSEQDARSVVLHLNVDGQAASGAPRLAEAQGDGVWMSRATVDLGRDVGADEAVDLEVWAELPQEGGVSRWVYQDIEIGSSCRVAASWSGDWSGSVSWTPEDASWYSGFEIRGRTLDVSTGVFNLTAEFGTPIAQNQPGRYDGRVTYFYVTDATWGDGPGRGAPAGIAFPQEEMGVYAGVPVSLTISRWTESQIEGSVQTGVFSSQAIGPNAPTEPGPAGPLRKRLSISGSAAFQASGDFRPSGLPIRCHAARSGSRF